MAKKKRTTRKEPLKLGRAADGWPCVLPDQPGVYHLVAKTPHGGQMMRVVRSAQ
ncbi:MAG: hypothetical protein KDB93_12395 [Flavobacteriales bacterium]|nr:hypothetical protein [Flavobacteriales bacterium]